MPCAVTLQCFKKLGIGVYDAENIIKSMGIRPRTIQMRVLKNLTSRKIKHRHFNKPVIEPLYNNLVKGEVNY